MKIKGFFVVVPVEGMDGGGGGRYGAYLLPQGKFEN